LTRRRWLLPYLLMAPGLLWLAAFFVLPNLQMVLMSLSTGSISQGWTFAWDFDNYLGAFGRFPDNFRNSLVYGGMATLICFLTGYPMAYGIAFRGGRYKTLLLFLVIAPFFTSFLIRTISWRILLGDQGPFLAVVRETLHVVPDNFSIIGTPLAVVAGLIYQFLPFMVLPLYVALEKIDKRLIEAARDLYAGPWRRGGAIAGSIAGGALVAFVLTGLGYAKLEDGGVVGFVAAVAAGAVVGGLIGAFLISESFVRVTWPLSVPGVFAGSILVFIPAIGDFVNVELLGNPKSQMIGNVIQNRFLQQNDYPTAAALSFILMAGILIAIFIYARVLGTEELTGGRS
jgi:spermidine/putrescine transport system permease protein